jgi:hypothetical protein
VAIVEIGGGLNWQEGEQLSTNNRPAMKAAQQGRKQGDRPDLRKYWMEYSSTRLTQRILS